jgi:hypothetical protein
MDAPDKAMRMSHPAVVHYLVVAITGLVAFGSSLVWYSLWLF